MVWIIALLLVTMATSRAEIVYNFSWGVPGGPGPLPQFDPSQGTLLFVSISFEEDYRITYDVGSGGGLVSFDAGGGGSDYVDGFLFGSGIIVDLSPTIPEYFPPNSVASYYFDGGFGNAIGSGSGAVFDAMIGTGSVSWGCDCAVYANPGNLTPLSGSLTLDYNYIPEPGTYGLMLASLGALVFAVRKRSINRPPDH